MRVLALFGEILDKCASNTELLVVLLHPWHQINIADDQTGATDLVEFSARSGEKR